MSWQAKIYSQLLDEVVDVGHPSEDFDEVLGLGEFMAAGRDSLIVFVDGPRLPEWKDET